MKKAYIISLLGVLFLTGCSQTTQQTTEKGQGEGYPVTVQNFSKAEGAESWQKKSRPLRKLLKKF